MLGPGWPSGRGPWLGRLVALTGEELSAPVLGKAQRGGLSYGYRGDPGGARGARPGRGRPMEDLPLHAAGAQDRGAALDPEPPGQGGVRDLLPGPGGGPGRRGVQPPPGPRLRLPLLPRPRHRDDPRRYRPRRVSRPARQEERSQQRRAPDSGPLLEPRPENRFNLGAHRRP